MKCKGSQDYYKQHCTNKMDNLEELDKVPRSIQSPKTQSGRNRKYE